MDKKANEINCPKYATTTEKKKPYYFTQPRKTPHLSWFPQLLAKEKTREFLKPSLKLLTRCLASNPSMSNLFLSIRRKRVVTFSIKLNSSKLSWPLWVTTAGINSICLCFLPVLLFKLARSEINWYFALFLSTALATVVRSALSNLDWRPLKYNDVGHFDVYFS